MKIGVDLDDVLLGCNASLALYHNARYGTSYKREDIRSWHLERIWGCTPEEAVVRARGWYTSPEHAESLPMPGAQEGIAELRKSYELHIITSRPAHVRELTQTWLDKHFPEQFAGVHFTSNFEPGAGSKAEICKSLGVSLLIEDSLHHARDVASCGIDVLLFDCPWNQEPIPEYVTRVFTWRGVLNFAAYVKASVE